MSEQVIRFSYQLPIDLVSRELTNIQAILTSKGYELSLEEILETIRHIAPQVHDIDTYVYEAIALRIINHLNNNKEQLNVRSKSIH